MKNTKVLGLAILASFIALPAFAGETYVRNEWINTKTTTDTNLHLDSVTNSTRKEKYDSFAYKEYYEGSKKVDYGFGPKGKTVTVNYGDGYTEHIAGSFLWGNFMEQIKTTIDGNIKSNSVENSKAHETSAGVR